MIRSPLTSQNQARGNRASPKAPEVSTPWPSPLRRKIVEDLPSGKHREGLLPSDAHGDGNLRQKQAQRAICQSRGIPQRGGGYTSVPIMRGIPRTCICTIR